MIAQFTQWLADLVTQTLGLLFTLIGDVLILFLKLVLFAISGLIMLIPAPCCVAGTGLTALFNNFPPYVGYFVGTLNLHGFFVIILCGFTFRMVRKAVTLGQW